MESRRIPHSTTLNPIDLALEIAALAAFLAPWGLIYYFWDTLPSQIPLHFDMQGNINSWGGKESLIIAPLMGVGSYILLSVLSSSHASPEWFNLPKGVDRNNPAILTLVRRMLKWLKLLTSSVMATIVWMQIQGALRIQSTLTNFIFWVVLGLMITIPFYYFIQIKQVPSRGEEA